MRRIISLDGVGGLSGTDIGTAGAVAVPRWSLDAGNALVSVQVVIALITKTSHLSRLLEKC